MYDKIAKWYRQGLWKAQQVQNAVAKGVLTQAQADELTGGDANGPDLQPEN